RRGAGLPVRTGPEPGLYRWEEHLALPGREVLDQPGRDQQREDDAHGDDEQRRLDEQPPEALAVRVQDRQAVRLQERPDDTAEHRQRPERGDDPGSCRAGTRSDALLDQLCAHSTSPGRDDNRPAAPIATAGYAGRGGGRLARARPKSLRGGTSVETRLRIGGVILERVAWSAR